MSKHAPNRAEPFKTQPSKRHKLPQCRGGTVIFCKFMEYQSQHVQGVITSFIYLFYFTFISHE